MFNWQYFLRVIPELLGALPVTLSVGVLAMGLGLLLGTLIGILRHAQIPALDWGLRWYISFFRGTPLMVQLFLFFYGLPQVFPVFGKLNAFQAALVIMSINASAYIAETIRGAISSIDPLQMDAGLSMGFTYWQTLVYIVLPQAFRAAVPPLGNTFIGVIQGTALTFMLGLQDIMGLSKMRAAASYRFFETYLAVGLIYWAIMLIIGQLNKQLEARLSKGWRY